jgi:lysophospholipase L1-like esterase
VAKKVMESNGVPIDDLTEAVLQLNQAAASNRQQLTREDVSRLGEGVASAISRAMEFAPIKDDPKLPSILLIGDSISIGYTLPLRSLLAGKANVHRIPCNGQSTDYALRNLKNWLGESKWDVIHFNWGIWDAHIFAGGSYRVPIAQYRKNLTLLVQQLQATGARLVWASTTPLQPRERQGRDLWVRATDIPLYNAAAKEVMEAQGISIDDLYVVALPKLVSLQADDGVHFTTEGSWVLARRAAEKIQSQLAPAKNVSARNYDVLAQRSNSKFIRRQQAGR